MCVKGTSTTVCTECGPDTSNNPYYLLANVGCMEIKLHFPNCQGMKFDTTTTFRNANGCTACTVGYYYDPTLFHCNALFTCT